MKKPKFESNADATLERVRNTYSQRGGEYADTWGTCRFLAMQAVARELGIKIDGLHYRALATAAFCDMKNERLSGGWKEDSMIDGIAYDAFLVEEMRLLKQDRKDDPETDFGNIEWRELAPGEEILPGDQWHDFIKGSWEEVFESAGKVTMGNRYRRKAGKNIERCPIVVVRGSEVHTVDRQPDGEGGEEKWRMLVQGEPIKKGDQWYSCDGKWIETVSEAKEGDVYREIFRPYRRRVS